MTTTKDLYVQRLKRKQEEQNQPHEDPKPQRVVLYTDPLPKNTNTDVFQYVFGSSCSLDFFGSRFVDQLCIVKHIKCGIPWEEARYLIEKRHNLFDVKQRKANSIGSYIQGFLWEPHFHNWRKQAQPIPKDRMMTFSDQVIVVVKPLPPNVPAYIPERFRAEMEVLQREAMTPEERQKEERVNKFIDFLKASSKIKEDMSEDDKIKAIMEQMDADLSLDQLKDKLLHKHRRQKIQHQPFHPADLELNPALSKPPDHYVCHRCGQHGHWKNMCHTLNDASFVPLTQLRVPTGIPKSMLREAVTNEEKQHAMRTDDGRLVVRVIR